MTFVLVSVLYKHVCECIDDPFATPVTDATHLPPFLAKLVHGKVTDMMAD